MACPPGHKSEQVQEDLQRGDLCVVGPELTKLPDPCVLDHIEEEVTCLALGYRVELVVGDLGLPNGLLLADDLVGRLFVDGVVVRRRLRWPGEQLAAVVLLVLSGG